MGFRLAPREVAPFPPQPGSVPRFRPFWVRFSLFGSLKSNEAGRVELSNFMAPFPHTEEME